MTEKTIMDPCGNTNYDDPDHRRYPETPDSPPNGPAVSIGIAQRDYRLETVSTNSGEISDIGDGEKIFEGKGETIKVFAGGVAKSKEQKEQKSKWVFNKREV